MIITILMGLPAFPYEKETESLLVTLDSVLEKSDEYIGVKELRIDQLRKKISPQMNDEERLWLNKMLFDEYAVYKADSAMAYTRENIAIARRLDRKSLEQKWQIEQSFLFAAQGLLYEAQKNLTEVDVDAIDEKEKYFYYETAIYIYSHLSQYIRQENGMTEVYDSIANGLKKEALRHIAASHPSYYVLKVSTLSGPSDPEWQTVKSKLMEQLGEPPLSSRASAIKAYTLAKMCEAEGDKTGRINYLIQSAIADVRICNRDIASLEELSDMFYQEGDLERGYECINHCLRAALLYPNRVRVFNILSVFDKLQQAGELNSIKQKQRIKNSLIVVCLLCVVLLMVAVVTFTQFFKLKHAHANAVQSEALLKSRMDELNEMQKRLSELNEKLTLTNDKLRRNNDKLVELNEVKEEYVGYVFAICSNYLSKIEDFRKEISRKIKVGQIDDVRKLIQNPQIGQKELREFYHRFDTIFLHLYPGFVEDFNALLRPEERIVLKQDELLNTYLRIYALVRLGINDSVRISEFLHISAQTVYNNRLKIRNCAIDSKDEFIAKVRQLGKTSPLDSAPV